MIEQIVLAIVVACIVGLLLLFLGRILTTLAIPIAVAVGGFLEQWCWVIGVLVGLIFFFTGASFFGLGGHKPFN